MVELHITYTEECMVILTVTEVDTKQTYVDTVTYIDLCLRYPHIAPLWEITDFTSLYK